MGTTVPQLPAERSRQRAVWAVGMLAAIVAWRVAPAVFSGSFPALFLGLLALLALCSAAAGPARENACAAPRSFLTGCLVGLAGLTLALNFADVALQCWDYAVLRLGDTVVDGRELAKMAAIARGGTMYPPVTDYPYFITLYTPVYHYLGALASLLLPDAVLAAHILTYAAHAALFVVLTVWIRAESGRFWGALAIALALVLGPYYGTYVLKTRPDILAWLFAFSGAFLFSRGIAPGGGRSSRVWAAVLLSLAILTKQQTLPILLAMATVFVVRRGTFGACLRFAALALAVSVGLYGAFYLATGGDIVLHTLVYPSRLAGDPAITNLANAWPRLRDLGLAYWGLFLLYALALAADLRRRRLHVLDWALLVQLPFLMTLVSTWGADMNYFLGVILTVGIRAGIFLAALRVGRYTVPVFLAGLLLLLPAPPLPGDLAAHRPDPALADEAATLRAIAAGGNTLVNSEGSIPFVAVTPEIPVKYFDVADMGFFESVKLFNFPASRLGRDIAQKRFDHIILSNTFVVPRYLHHILAAYVPERTIGVYTVYAPRPGRNLAITDLQKNAAAGEARIDVAGMENMEFGTGFGARFAASRTRTEPGRITLRLADGHPMDTVTLGYYPKVHPVAAGNRVTIEWSRDGTTFSPLAGYKGMGNDTQTDLFSPALFASFAPDAPVAYIRFTFYGAAQLWYSETTPMTLTIE